MCGIAGFLDFRDDAALRAMTEALAHRGPDDQGFYCSEAVSLAHRRLSIIDLSPAGRQPMSNEDRTCRLVFNGEIYNFPVLRRELEARGHRFRSRTDSEVILHQYEEEGPSCLQRFNGMFALALWDERRRRLLLARDRLGIKPLYYYWDGRCFLFASEIKALIRAPQLHRALYLPGVYQNLMLRYCPPPHTVLQNVYKLPPGHYLLKSPGRPPRVEAYWRPPRRRWRGDRRGAEEYLLGLLGDAVQRRLVADVPLGVMLSGGVDSGTICALAAAASGEALLTFSLGFAGQPDNEFAPARLSARRFRTRHHSLTVSSAHFGLVPRVIWHNDEPVAGPSSLAFYLGLGQARRRVTVLLFGHGADEILAGYEELKIQKLVAPFQRPALARPLRPVAGLLSRARGREAVWGRLGRYLQSLSRPERNFLYLVAVMDPLELGGLLRGRGGAELEEAVARTHALAREEFQAAAHPLEAIQRFELRGWLCEDILLRVDRMTMAHSLEGRVPFLDHRVVELALSLPLEWKLAGLEEKAVLRSAVQGLLPEEVRRRAKQRFNTPIDRFFAPQTLALCRRLFQEDNALNQSVFRPRRLLALLDYPRSRSYRWLLRRHKLAAQFYARQVWNLLVLQLWCKMYLEDQDPAEVLEPYDL